MCKTSVKSAVRYGPVPSRGDELGPTTAAETSLYRLLASVYLEIETDHCLMDPHF